MTNARPFLFFNIFNLISPCARAKPPSVPGRAFQIKFSFARSLETYFSLWPLMQAMASAAWCYSFVSYRDGFLIKILVLLRVSQPSRTSR